MIIHNETNDGLSSTSREIQDNLLKLKSLVKEKLPQYKIWLSNFTLKTDKTQHTILEICTKKNSP